MKKIIDRNFNFLIAILLVVCITGENAWHKSVPLSTNALDFFLGYLGLFFLYLQAKHGKNLVDKKTRRLITLYFIWFGFTCLRGPFMAVDYFSYRNLVFSIPITFFPLFFYVFSDPYKLGRFLRGWVLFCLPLFLIIAFDITPGSYGFYLSPITILSLFFFSVQKKWSIFLLLITIIVVVSDISARSTIVKLAAPLLLAIAYFFRQIISAKLLKIVGWLFILAPFILIPLAAFGSFNIFQDSGYSQSITSGSTGEELDFFDDTRTFIYYEVINSAIENDYVFWGRTPARGNDTQTILFNDFNDEHHRPVQERFANEIGAANAFTHFGLIGLIIMLLFYYFAAYLAFNKSNSYYMKLIGVVICFRSFWFFVEDYYSFRIQAFALIFLIGMALSEKFRAMTDKDFKVWINSILK